ncbi:MAG: hypothetical protein JXR51_08135 [Bacteroidales bacterium]|nr:hypothetical protein [Bacteroidales bacterium]MBN2757129.1 hypothetical protein [Bacteroidales bacterium]
MILSRKHIINNLISLSLLAIFIFPTIYQSSHYLFIEHHYSEVSNNIEKTKIETEHFNCEIDWFNFSKVDFVDYKVKLDSFAKLIDNFLVLNSIPAKNKIFLSFLLRAPPVIITDI